MPAQVVLESAEEEMMFARLAQAHGNARACMYTFDLNQVRFSLRSNCPRLGEYFTGFAFALFGSTWNWNAMEILNQENHIR